MAFPKKMKSSGPGARGVSNADVDRASGKGAGVGRPMFKKGGMVTKGKAADREMKNMEKKAKSGKGTLSFTPKGKK